MQHIRILCSAAHRRERTRAEESAGDRKAERALNGSLHRFPRSTGYENDVICYRTPRHPPRSRPSHRPTSLPSQNSASRRISGQIEYLQLFLLRRSHRDLFKRLSPVMESSVYLYLVSASSSVMYRDLMEIGAGQREGFVDICCVRRILISAQRPN